MLNALSHVTDVLKLAMSTVTHFRKAANTIQLMHTCIITVHKGRTRRYRLHNEIDFDQLRVVGNNKVDYLIGMRWSIFAWIKILAIAIVHSQWIWYAMPAQARHITSSHRPDQTVLRICQLDLCSVHSTLITST